MGSRPNKHDVMGFPSEVELELFGLSKQTQTSDIHSGTAHFSKLVSLEPLRPQLSAVLARSASLWKTRGAVSYVEIR